MEGHLPSYEWFVTPAGGSVTPSGTGSTFTYAPADGDAVYAIMTSNATPCLAGSPATSAPVMMNINPLPVSNDIIGSTVICEGSTLVDYQITTDNSSTTTCIWSYNGTGATLSSTSGTAITIDYAIGAESGILTVIESDVITARSTTNTLAITINPLPTVIITNPASVCEPAVVDITDAAIVATSNAGLTYTYWEDAGATIEITQGNAAAIATSGTYYIKGTSATGCFDIQAVNVTINAQVVLSINDPVAVCTSATVNLTDPAITLGSSEGLEFSYWTDAEATLTYGTPETATAGTYYIKGVMPATGCFDIRIAGKCNYAPLSVYR